jgi:hypothetical protein
VEGSLTARAIRRHRAASALSSADVIICVTSLNAANRPNIENFYRGKERTVCSKQLSGRAMCRLGVQSSAEAKLPKAEHDAEEWQAAMQALLLVAEQDGPSMFARIGIMRALNRGYVREFNNSRKDTHWG